MLTPSPHANAVLARALYDAFNRDDVERALALAAEDVTLMTVASHHSEHGHTGLRHFLATWHALARDSRVEVVRQWAGEYGVTSECRFRGTRTVPAPPADGQSGTMEQSIDWPFVDSWTVTNGKLSSLHSYLDPAALQTATDPAPAVMQA